MEFTAIGQAIIITVSILIIRRTIAICICIVIIIWCIPAIRIKGIIQAVAITIYSC